MEVIKDRTASVETTKSSGETRKKISILENCYKLSESKAKNTKGIEIKGIVDMGVDVTIISPKFWYPDWPLQEVSVQFLGIGTVFQVK